MAASAAVTADLVAGVAQLRDGLDVVPVAMGLEDLAHAEVAAELEQLLVLVGGIDEHGVACLLAADDEDVVVDRPDDDLVDLDLLVLGSARCCLLCGPFGGMSPPAGDRPGDRVRFAGAR